MSQFIPATPEESLGVGGPGAGENPLSRPRPAPKPKRKPPVKAPSPVRTPTGQVVTPPAPAPRGLPISAGQGPVLATPAAPIPMQLRVHGINQSINGVNNRVQSVVTAYRNAFGWDPSPGLVFDVIRSNVPDAQIPSLFSFGKPQPFGAQMTQDRLVNNGFHKATTFSPLLAQVASFVTDHPLTGKEQFHQALLSHPTYEAGLLPLPNMVSLNEDMKLLQQAATGGAIQVTENGITLQQAQAGQTGTGWMSGATPGTAVPQTSRIMGAIKNLKDSQVAMNKLMGTDLPVTGYYNADWLKAVTRFSHTAQAVQAQGLAQAHAAGFSNYPDYLKAFQAKVHAVEHTPGAQYILNGMPVYMYSHGASPLGIAAAITHHVLNGFDSADPLQGLTRAGGVAFDLMGGSWSELEAWTAAANSVAQLMSVNAVSGRHTNYDDAMKALHKGLTEQPSLLQAIAGGHTLPENNPYVKAATIGTEILGALIISHKPFMTGEVVEAGNAVKAANSSYLNWAGKWAYRYAAEGKTNRAVSMLEGGQGARKLVTQAMPLIKQGRLTEDEFKQSLADLYAHGYTQFTVPALKAEGGALNKALRSKVVEIDGTQGDVPLASLRSRQLKTPGLITRSTTKVVKRNLRDFVDSADMNIRASSRFTGVNQTAANFIHNMRVTATHAAPTGDFRHFFEDQLGQRVHDFVLKYQLGGEAGSSDLANAFENKLINAQARESVPQIQAVNHALRKAFREKYPGEPIADDPFHAGKMTELPSRFYFPSPDPAVDAETYQTGLKNLGNTAHSINRELNELATHHRRIILSGAPLPGGEILFFKHAVSDTIRRYLGDGGMKGAVGRKWESDFHSLLDNNQAMARQYGLTTKRNIESETRYMGNSKQFRESYELTGDGGVRLPDGTIVGGSKRSIRPYQEATGAWLRRFVSDDIFEAYVNSSPSDLSPMVDVIQHNKNYNAMFKNAMKAREDERDAALPAGLRTYVGTATAARFGVSIPPTLTMEEFAGLLRNEFDHIGSALAANGQSWDDLRTAWMNTVKKGTAHGDQMLGKFAHDSGLQFSVKDAQVQHINKFDDLMVQYIGFLMKPNKWNRGQMFQNVFARQYGTLREAGWNAESAANTAMSVAEKQTVYHMLDFANMLQVEQDLRWMSYFATKHRLYLKWMISTMAHNPATILAAKQIGSILDQNGNYQLPVKVWGQTVAIPVKRLFFLQSRDYSNWSIFVQAAAGLLKTGNITSALGGSYAGLARSADAMLITGNAMAISSGIRPATTANLTYGLSASAKRSAYRFAHDYIVSVEEHNGGIPPSEEDVTHWVMWRLASSTAWNANVPLPVVLETGQATRSPKLVADLAEYQSIIDPAKSRQFLLDHPDVANSFGMSMNPKDRIYLDGFWHQYNRASDLMRSQRDALINSYLGKRIDNAYFKKRDAIDSAFEETYNRLLLLDAVQTGQTVTAADGTQRVAENGYGKWGQQVSVDPLTDPVVGDPVKFLHKYFPAIPLKTLASHTVNDTVNKANAMLQFLRDPALLQSGVFSTPEGQDSVKTMKRLLLDFTDAFHGVPKDKLGKESSWYLNNVAIPYAHQSEAKYQAILKLPSNERDVAYAKLRAWKDSQDATVTHDGVTWPSPTQLSWVEMNAATRHQRLAQLASSDPAHLASYELRQLGYDAPKSATTGWATFHVLLDYARQQGTTGLDKAALAKIVEKGGYSVDGVDYGPHPGFVKLFTFATQPRAVTMSSYKFIQESPYYSTDPGWKELLQAASKVALAPNVSATDKRTGWLKAVGTPQQPGPMRKWIAQNPRFQRELALFGPDLLNTLISTQSP